MFSFSSRSMLSCTHRSPHHHSSCKIDHLCTTLLAPPPLPFPFSACTLPSSASTAVSSRSLFSRPYHLLLLPKITLLLKYSLSSVRVRPSVRVMAWPDNLFIRYVRYIPYHTIPHHICTGGLFNERTRFRFHFVVIFFFFFFGGIPILTVPPLRTDFIVQLLFVDI
ncbi:hypothetical protein GYMLUDRAFT_914333 [Collybiopsis luxurians FD-317 M1]|nr:hypothetical protein GYMLUDRAFT_914333 [Collybiopsis luxurians FD-317 M1]